MGVNLLLPCVRDAQLLIDGLWDMKVGMELQILQRWSSVRSNRCHSAEAVVNLIIMTVGLIRTDKGKSVARLKCQPYDMPGGITLYARFNRTAVHHMHRSVYFTLCCIETLYQTETLGEPNNLEAVARPGKINENLHFPFYIFHSI
jgi:hypothetical protein